MKSYKKITSVIILILMIFVNSDIALCDCQKFNNINSDDIEQYILFEMETKHIPGLSTSVFIDETIIFQQAFGYADIEQNIRVTNDTLFKIGSVSKTVTATALMKLYELELFNLDDPINYYLPFNVVHPDYSFVDITFHMLLTHSSGIIDNWDYLFYFEGDSPISFQTFLHEYLVSGGDYYDSDKNFGSWEPGTSISYSNIAVALIGYLVEIISNMNFTDYFETYIFNPLYMNESAWYLRDLNISNIALPYHWNGNEYITYGHLGYVDVPAGDLRTSSSQLKNFLMMYVNNGTFDSNEILNNNTIKLMLTPQLPFNNNLGLIWWKSVIGGRTVWGHDGSDFGARALMKFDPITKIGVIILINGEAGITQISNRLFEYAETFLNNFPPTPPEITGITNGKSGIEYEYKLVTSDPEGDKVQFYIEWGDNETEWTELIDSGYEIELKHTWSEQGYYSIRTKAKDSYNAESNWSTLEVSIPKNKQIFFKSKFINIYKEFCYFFPLFRHYFNS